ncbi:transposase, partial [Achromatium sp. WMS3]
MPNYIRAFVPGGTFFFTVTLLERQRCLLTEYINDLRKVFYDVIQRYPFTIDAVVVLPDHIHCIWTLPANDSDFSKRWYSIKSRFSAKIPKGERLSERRIKKGERGIWQ